MTLQQAREKAREALKPGFRPGATVSIAPSLTAGYAYVTVRKFGKRYYHVPVTTLAERGIAWI